MVRLRRWQQFDRDWRVYVSIPLWCDCDLYGRWSSANDSYWCALKPVGGNDYQLAIRASVANINSENTGVVATDPSGEIELRVGGASVSALWVLIAGYFI
jgi:hypothetical protein